MAHGFDKGFRLGMNLELSVNALQVEDDGVNCDAELLSNTFEVMAFDMASQQLKPFVKAHLETLHRQLLGLVNETIAKSQLRNADPEAMTEIISSAVMAFHHPRLVAQYVDEQRESLLHQVIDSLLKGLNLKK